MVHEALKDADRMEHDMSIKAPYLAIGATILVAIVVACDSREQNALRSPTTPAPGTPVASLVRLELVAPESIAPGESVQLTANAVKSDDSVENVSGQAQWTSSDRRVIEISPTGVAKAIARGEALIMAGYQSRSASTRTFVLPADTYRLNGTVSDSGFGLAGVSVSIIDGVGHGLTTTTNENGGFALYGVRDRVWVQARGAGYLDQIQEVDVSGHRTVSLEMRLARQRTDVRGNYRLTIDRTPCSVAGGAGNPIVRRDGRPG